jgi:hypothetical protein
MDSTAAGEAMPRDANAPNGIFLVLCPIASRSQLTAGVFDVQRCTEDRWGLALSALPEPGPLPTRCAGLQPFFKIGPSLAGRCVNPTVFNGLENESIDLLKPGQMPQAEMGRS